MGLVGASHTSPCSVINIKTDVIIIITCWMVGCF